MVTVGRDAAHVVSGLQDLVVLKSTGSEFKGFLVDEFTTLAEADDRILATSLVARWRHEADATSDWNASYDEVRDALLSTFATTYSRALQETLYLMGSRVVDTLPGIAEIRFSAPNKHHFLVDFSGFDVEGLTNEGEVFVAADRPYGLIECQVRATERRRRRSLAAVPGFADGPPDQLLSCLSVPRWADDVLAGEPYADRAGVAGPRRRSGPRRSPTRSSTRRCRRTRGSVSAAAPR